ncbi:MAG: SDR family NAD(P)-dependent oxidoreductase, partial [Candidatus Eremiobacteraeota bacterium]|nr:SDR family NAD(P)-dependent oxidoreductase [Candidatus Eremiobacteraeota bacterium]
MPNLLAGDIAVITGADSGIGQATAVEFGREGASVVIVYLSDREGADSTRQQVEREAARAIIVQADVGVQADVERIFRQCEATLGAATILVNNAGVDASGTPVVDMPLETWERAIRTNLTGQFLCAQQFLRRFSDGDGRRGRIINISSVHQDIPRAGAAEYDASKGGVRNLTTTLALELAERRITVNAIAPGMVLTPMNQEALDDPKAREQQV